MRMRKSHKAQVEYQEFGSVGMGKLNSKARICITFLIAFEKRVSSGEKRRTHKPFGILNSNQIATW